MPKKARKKLKSKYHASGLPRVDYHAASATGPTARMKRGQSTIVSHEELGETRRRRPAEKEWKQIARLFEKGDFKHLDDFAAAFGIGFAQEVGMEATDEIAGLLLSLVPWEKKLGMPGKTRKVGWFDTRQSQKAIDELFTLYGKEFAGVEMTGRAVALVGQMVFLGGAPAIAMLATAIPRYGLKGSIKLVQKTTQAIEKDPTIGKELRRGAAKGMAKAFNKIKQIYNKKTVRDAGPVGQLTEAMAQQTMASKKTGYEAVKEAAGNPWTYAGSGLSATLKGLGKAVNFTEDKIYKDWLPRLERKKAKLKLKMAGYSDAAIDYMLKNKNFFPKGQRSTPNEVVETFKLAIEDALNANYSLESLARSIVGRSPRLHNPAANGMVADVNAQIMDLFKDPKYKPTYLEDPIGEASRLTGIDEEDLAKSLGIGKVDEQDIRHVAEIDAGGKSNLPKDQPESAVPGEIYDSKDLKGKSPKLTEVKIKTPKGKAREKRLSNYEKTGSPERSGDDPVTDQTAPYIGEKVDPIQEGGQAQIKRQFYDPKLPNKSKEAILGLPYIQEFLKSNPGSRKVFEELLSLRDRLLQGGNITDQQFLNEVRQVNGKANLNKSFKDSNFDSDEDAIRYERAFGSLRRKFDDRFKKHNARYEKRNAPVAEFYEALKGGPRTSPDRSFQEVFGIEYEIKYLPDGTTYITVDFPNPEKTLNALEQALLIGEYKGPYNRPQYTSLLKNFLNASARSINDNKAFKAKDRAVPSDLAGGEEVSDPTLSVSKIKEGRPGEKFRRVLAPHKWEMGSKESGRKGRGTSKSLGRYYKSIEVQDIFDKLKGQMATRKFSDPASANAIIEKMYQDLFGITDDPTLRAAIKPIRTATGDEAGMSRRLLTRVFMGSHKMQALYLADLASRKALQKGASLPQDLIHDAEEFAEKMQKDPSFVRDRFPEWVQDFFKGGKKQGEFSEPQQAFLRDEDRIRAIKQKPSDGIRSDTEGLQNLKSWIDFGEEYGRPHTRTMGRSDPSRELLYTPKEMDYQPETFDEGERLTDPGPEEVVAPAGENLTPAEWPGIPFQREGEGEFEESFEVENVVDPEIEDREKRKDRINAFLKQQGAYKRRKRKSYA